jgi:hypothetical protein
MTIRTIIGAASAAIAIATAALASAHDVGDKVTPNFQQAIPNILGKSLIARGRRLSAGWGLGATYPRKIVLHLRLRHIRKHRVEGERRPDTDLHGGRELVRTTRRQPSHQPQYEQDRAGKAARGLRCRYRRKGPDHTRQIEAGDQGEQQ